jgi:glycosyltransferase involved in cell wall biosynthesis
MIYAIMTAFNEAGSLLTLLPRMPATVNGHDLRIIVVDDGSADATADVARAHGCTVIRSEVNRGKGASLRTGLDALTDRHFDAVVLMDSDGQHDPARLAALTEPILDGVAEMVVGSRYLATTKRGQTPWNRYLVRSGTVSVLNTILSTNVTDPYSGYRALTPRAIECITLRGDRYESELEMLFCAKRRGLRVVEVPIPKIYGSATSKMGARKGRVLGRIDVVSRYALTIARETARLGRSNQPKSKETVSP